MDLSLDDDSQAIQGAFHDFFAQKSPIEIVRKVEPLGFDEELWRSFGGMDGTTMAIPQSAGGGGGDALALSLVAIEAGRQLAAIPFVEHAVASRLLAAAGATNLVNRLVETSAIATVALRPAVAGVYGLVPAGAIADIVVALENDELIAYLRPPGVTSEVAPNFGSMPLANWPVDEMERVLLTSGPQAALLHADARATWQLLTSASLNGLRAAALEIGVDYVKNREAFGVPIGWFQTIQQRLADVAVAGDGATYLLYEAAWAHDRRHSRTKELSAMSFLYNSKVAFDTARESLQFHGGYGYTLEYDIQLYYRRAKAWPLVLGDPRREHANLATIIFGE